MKWFCAQIGAREHYAIPRALQQSGCLAVLYTDFWAGALTQTVASGLKLGALRSLAARWHPELRNKAETLKAERLKAGRKPTPHPGPLPGRSGEGEEQESKAEIVSWNLRALWWELLRKRKTESGKRKTENGNLKSDGGGRRWSEMAGEAAGRHLTPTLSPNEAKREGKRGDGRSKMGDGGGKTAGTNQFQISDFSVSAFSPYHGFIEVGRRFATCVREDLKRRKDLRPNTIFYAYDTGALEALEWCREHGVKCVLNQMDPNRVEVDLVRAEEQLWPGWALQTLMVPEAYFVRREREWALADRIVVNSEFSRRALLQQGVPLGKLIVIPLCYEAAELNQKSEIRNQKSHEPLRVLFLGQVILRKGIQYLIAAARLLEKENIHFDIVGPVGISAMAIATAPKNMTFHGRAGRNQAADWYQRADLFVLPTLSDGFALTQLEAMAHGLPVVTTPCCGDVVNDGVDGFVVPPREVEVLVQVFRRYLAEPELLPSQSAAARVKARQFTVHRLAENLRQLENALKQANTLKS